MSQTSMPFSLSLVQDVSAKNIQDVSSKNIQDESAKNVRVLQVRDISAKNVHDESAKNVRVLVQNNPAKNIQDESAKNIQGESAKNIQGESAKNIQDESAKNIRDPVSASAQDFSSLMGSCASQPRKNNNIQDMPDQHNARSKLPILDSNKALSSTEMMASSSATSTSLTQLITLIELT